MTGCRAGLRTPAWSLMRWPWLPPTTCCGASLGAAMPSTLHPGGCMYEGMIHIKCVLSPCSVCTKHAPAEVRLVCSPHMLLYVSKPSTSCLSSVCKFLTSYRSQATIAGAAIGIPSLPARPAEACVLGAEEYKEK